MDEKTKTEILAKLEWTQNALNRLADELAFLNNVLDLVAEQRDGAVQPQQNLAVTDETLTVSQAIDDLLGYLELDLENRELDEKEHWLEVFQVVHGWHNAAKF